MTMKISVLTPSLNSARYIRRAIESVLRQDYANWEHIVMDGGSKDDTLSILKEYSHLQWGSSPDQGQSDAMNKAYLKSSGDIIMYLNADDELEEGFFSTIVKQFELHQDADMIVCNLKMNNQGKISIRKPSVSLLTILQYWPCKFPLNPVAYAYRKNLQEKTGLFPLGNHYSMDYWFLLRAYLVGTIIKHEFIGGTYHIDGRNKSADVDRSKQHLRAVRNNFLRTFFYKPVVAFFIIMSPFRIVVSSIRKILKRLAQRARR